MLFAQSAADLIKLLPDGASVVAVIIVVILFLKQQDKFNSVLKDVNSQNNSEANASQKAYQEQINNMATQYFTNQKSFQDQIQRLMDAHILVTRETITSLQELKSMIASFLREQQAKP